MPVNPRSMANLKRGKARQSAQLLPDLPAPIVEADMIAPDVGGSAAGIQAVGGNAAGILRDVSPHAALLLARLVTGAVRSAPHVRLTAAVKVLESQGLLGTQQSKPVEPQTSDMAAILDRVASALALRRAAAGATDAPVIGEETGEADTPPTA